MVRIAAILLFALLAGGCATTYIPISWGMGEKVKGFSTSDPFLALLFDRYDPDRVTLRVNGNSFDQVMMPSQVKYQLGAYRPDTRIIYRSLYQTYTDHQLRSLMLHELAHHVWHTGMTVKQREQWRQHLAENPSPLQEMVRRIYPEGADYDSEDFAYTVEHARDVDLKTLAAINVITEKDRDNLITRRRAEPPAPLPEGMVVLKAEPGSLGNDDSSEGHHPTP